jgi:hypothetical protein
LQTGDAQPELADFGLDRDTVHRWRQRAKNPSRVGEEFLAGMLPRT